MSLRVTRSRCRQPSAESIATYNPRTTNAILTAKIPTDCRIELLRQSLSRSYASLATKAHNLMQLKQTKLRDRGGQIPTFSRESKFAATPGSPSSLDVGAAATLVFAQEEAGTAVCISPNGLLLTCSHCVAESLGDLDLATPRWLLFSDGRIGKAQCVAWDDRRDLALLRAVAAQAAPTTPSVEQAAVAADDKPFPFVQVSQTHPRHNGLIICIGHPGSEDFEASEAGVQTGYDILHVSEGCFRGLVKDQDPQDNSEIGALKHDAWTYWGHSGAPLIDRSSGELVGLHSSWDDQTGMRRGVPLAAIKAFLDEHCITDSDLTASK